MDRCQEYFRMICMAYNFLIRSSDEPHSEVKPDGYVNNLAQAVELFLKYRL